MTEHIEFNGKTYYRTAEGYWRSTDKHRPLHRDIWEAAHGKIPDGYEIHHIDGNKDNNELSNLQCMTVAEHRRLHMKKSRAKGTLFPLKYKRICAECGKEFMATRKNVRFCSSECQTIYPRSQGAEIRICAVCGKEFATYKYGKSRFCSNECMNRGMGLAKFSDETIREIRRRHALGESLNALAREYHSHPSVISKIVKFETYKNV